MLKECPACHKTFDSPNRTQIRCSRACEISLRRGENKLTSICIVCESPFQRWPSDPQKVCGMACRKALYKLPRPTRRNNVAVPCDQCGTIFQASPTAKRRFCSHKCYAAHLEGIRGPDHPLYLGHVEAARPDLSTAEWKRRLRKRLIEKAGFRCTICGEAPLRLILHHKIEPTEAPDLVYAESNLQVVCQGCHNRIHNPVKARWAKYRQSHQ